MFFHPILADLGRYSGFLKALGARMTFGNLLVGLRLSSPVFIIALGAFMLGPLQGLERMFGLSAVMVHALAFYMLSLLLFAIAPRIRRTDLALIAFGMAFLIGLLQLLVGHPSNTAAWLASALGVTAAVAPSLLERLRHHFRNHYYIRVTDAQHLTRRRGRSRQADSTKRGQTAMARF